MIISTVQMSYKFIFRFCLIFKINTFQSVTQLKSVVAFQIISVTELNLSQSKLSKYIRQYTIVCIHNDRARLNGKQRYTIPVYAYMYDEKTA